MSGDFKRLKTHEFNRVLNDYAKYSAEFNEIRSSADTISQTLLEVWKGEGGRAFDMNFRQVQMNLKDVAGIMYDMHKELTNAYAEYMKTDETMSKKFDSQ